MNLSDSDFKFHDELLAEDTLGSVVRTHLHIEQELNRLLDNLILDFSVLKELNLNYKAKVLLAISMGLKKQYKAPLLGIGNIRNKFAHRKGYSLTKSDSKNLYESFSPPDKKIIQDGYKAIKELDEIPKMPMNKLSARDLFILCAVAVHNVLLSANNEFTNV